MYNYSWREYNWIGLPMSKKCGDFYEVIDLNIDHPAARYIENDLDAKIMAAAPDMLYVLEGIEWVKDPEGPRFCPYCYNTEDTGHMKNCKLAAALKKAKG